MQTLSNNRFKELMKLHQKKYRDLTNTFLVETPHLVEEAIQNNSVIEIFENDINTKYTYISDEQIKKLSQTDSKISIMALCNKKSNINNIYKGNIVILDDIQDPGNLGTILRTCKASNIDNVIISKNTCDPYNSKVIRSSQGAIFKTNIIEDDLIKVINDLKANHKEFKVYGTSLRNAESLSNYNFTTDNKYAIIFGNEGNGVKEEILNLTDKNIFIEINNMESLNVAISCGIILYKISIEQKK